VSLCTDNRLMSGVTLTEEYELARDRLGFTDEELRRIARFGFEAAFLPDATRQEMLTAFDRTVAAG
jgi:adenosine deaminase